VQVTFHQQHPVRFLSRTDQDDLVYGYDGEIWKLAKGVKELKTDALFFCTQGGPGGF